MIESSTPSSSILKSPALSRKRNQHSLTAASSPFRTPIKSPSRHHRTSRPRISPSSRDGRISSSLSKNATPGSNTSGDRFIPNRRTMNVEICRRVLLAEDNTQDEENKNKQSTNESCRTPKTETPLQKEYKRKMLSSLCNVPLEMIDEDARPKSLFRCGATSSSNAPRQQSHHMLDPYSLDTLHVFQQFEAPKHGSSENLSPSTNFATTVPRKIPTTWRKCLDAPNIRDDYYLNLISWSKDNILALIIQYTVYLWNGNTKQSHILTQIEGDHNYGASVEWCTIPGQTHLLALGTSEHTVQIWDTRRCCIVRSFFGHYRRVGSLAWNTRNNMLSSGGKDKVILQHDLRSPAHFESAYKGHRSEVCGMKWNEEGSALASGGNDNLLCIWDATMSSSSTSWQQREMPGWAVSTEIVRPRLVLQGHTSAVKALDWCPFRRGVLASGGGSNDRTIKLWNAHNGSILSSTNVGSQVCSLIWSKYQRELCSGHGYAQNHLVMWKYGSRSSLTRMQEMEGHTKRILNLACSPDGRTVVSLSADESLRFWDVFGEPPRSSSGDSMISGMGKLTFGMPTIR